MVKHVLLWLALAAALRADDLLRPEEPLLDRPTLMTLGVRLPVSGDDNFNARVDMWYRAAGSDLWVLALPPHRVRPEVVATPAALKITPEFAGSIFDLLPATTYDIVLHATDPDGADRWYNLRATTRSVPGDPAQPKVREVADADGLKAALAAAAPGDIILLADGVYAGQISISKAGTPENPIVIRGSSREGVILDGGCASCNVVEVYGAGFVHIERLSIRNGDAGIRFQTAGSTANVVRGVHISNTRRGIDGRLDQKDYYIADNILEGRLVWPSVYTDDKGSHSNDDGIRVLGNGHVVCHNRISGYGDAMKIEQDGARSVDFYNNEVLSAYDNGVELDGAAGNARAWRNRFTNTYATLSTQPIYGGPAYMFRNVVVNVAWEQMKLHALGGTPMQEPSGMYAFNNTFVSPPEALAINLQTTAPSHYFALLNNLFVTADSLAGRRIVDWTAPIDHGTLDYNGYYPAGSMRFHFGANGGLRNLPDMAAVQAAGMETHGLVIAGPLFANGLTAGASYKVYMEPQDVTLSSSSVALDKGLAIPNISDIYTGAGPDLGAHEFGCPLPVYGPRPAGMDESNEPFRCVGP